MSLLPVKLCTCPLRVNNDGNQRVLPEALTCSQDLQPEEGYHALLLNLPSRPPQITNDLKNPPIQGRITVEDARAHGALLRNCNDIMFAVTISYNDYYRNLKAPWLNFIFDMVQNAIDTFTTYMDGYIPLQCSNEQVII